MTKTSDGMVIEGLKPRQKFLRDQTFSADIELQEVGEQSYERDEGYSNSKDDGDSASNDEGDSDSAYGPSGHGNEDDGNIEKAIVLPTEAGEHVEVAQQLTEVEC
ncbi:hypothetical protein CRG98_030242 [Punica granatum]|uniref:Uncharacterized protein n=1 Tax=Punica granatum TaxID=22663 RepID=A0A2I0IZA4_PUNGR|nr:hypothetical protein CRG98_030242 [Punica granatum]